MDTPCPLPSATDTRVVSHGVLYLRKKPTNDCEQVSQLTLGALVHVLHEENGWAWVEGDDTYRGWADTRFLTHSPGTDAPEVPLRTITSPFAEVRTRPDTDAPLVVRLPMLSQLNADANSGDHWQVLLPDGKTTGWVAASAFDPLPHVPAAKIAAYAAKRGCDLLGTPYLWGGSSPFGIDCSGLVQFCYRLAGMILRRDAGIQRSDVRFFEVPLDDPKPGDLILFGRGPDDITHIGMALADGTFIHSAGGAGVIITSVGDDRYWPKRIDARRLDPTRALEPVIRHEAEGQ